MSDVDTSLRDLIERAVRLNPNDYTGPTSQKPIPVTRDEPTPKMPQPCETCEKAATYGRKFPIYVEYDTSDGVHHRHGYTPPFGA